jgi:hypothetical protein
LAAFTAATFTANCAEAAAAIEEEEEEEKEEEEDEDEDEEDDVEAADAAAAAASHSKTLPKAPAPRRWPRRHAPPYAESTVPGAKSIAI